MLATRLLDYGYNLRSLMYFEQIALHIQRDPNKYEPSFINKVSQYVIFWLKCKCYSNNIQKKTLFLRRSTNSPIVLNTTTQCWNAPWTINNPMLTVVWIISYRTSRSKSGCKTCAPLQCNIRWVCHDVALS